MSGKCRIINALKRGDPSAIITLSILSLLLPDAHNPATNHNSRKNCAPLPTGARFFAYIHISQICKKGL